MGPAEGAGRSRRGTGRSRTAAGGQSPRSGEAGRSWGRWGGAGGARRHLEKEAPTARRGSLVRAPWERGGRHCGASSRWSCWFSAPEAERRRHNCGSIWIHSPGPRTSRNARPQSTEGCHSRAGHAGRHPKLGPEAPAQEGCSGRRHRARGDGRPSLLGRSARRRGRSDSMLSRMQEKGQTSLKPEKAV